MQSGMRHTERVIWDVLLMSVSNKSLTVVIGRTHLDCVRIRTQNHGGDGQSQFCVNFETTEQRGKISLLGDSGGCCD